MTPHALRPTRRDESATVLLAFDGSPDAERAVSLAARLMPNAVCAVLTAWQPYLDMVARNGADFGILGEFDRAAEIDEAAEATARRTANAGAEIADKSGLNATPRAAAHPDGVAAAILAEADELEVTAIILGSRGLSGVKSLILGSVSHAVLQHPGRAVLVVPSKDRADSDLGHRRARLKAGPASATGKPA